MPRGPSADPVPKITISLPASLYEWARKRCAAARPPLSFSRYVQSLIARDEEQRSQLNELVERLGDAAEQHSKAKSAAKTKQAARKRAA